MFEDLKSKLKETAIKIKDLKSKRKIDRRGKYKLYDLECEIYNLKYEFRHHHIVYCELRGRTRKEIENPALNNLPNQDYIESIKRKFVNETIIRACQI